MANIIQERLDELGMNPNQLSKASGVGNNHLRLFMTDDENNRIKKPGRDKLIQIALALSWDIKEINRFLNLYEQKNFSEDDVSYVLKAIEKRKLYSGFNVIYSNNLNSHISFTKMESIAKSVKLNTGYFPYPIWDKKLRYNVIKLPMNKKSKDYITYLKIQEYINSKRKKIFEDYLEKAQYHQLLCAECLMSFIDNIAKILKEPSEIQHQFEEFFNYLQHKNYNFKIISICTRLSIEIIETFDNEYIVCPSGKYTGHSHKVSKNSISGLLTSSKELYNLFSAEYDSLKEYVIDESSDKKQTIKYIIKLLNERGIKMEYDI